MAFGYVDGPIAGFIGNLMHDGAYLDEIDFGGEYSPPPKSARTIQDWRLSMRGILLGNILAEDRTFAMLFGCEDNPPSKILWRNLTNAGNWIRANLKDPGPGRER